MSKQQRILSPEEEADLKRLMDEYNEALRRLPLYPYAIVFGSMVAGRMLGQKLHDIHPYLPLLLILACVVFLIFYVPYNKRRRLQNGTRLPPEIKREIKQKYNINLEQARAAFAKTYGPTVLDSLAADNRKRSRSIF